PPTPEETDPCNRCPGTGCREAESLPGLRLYELRGRRPAEPYSCRDTGMHRQSRPFPSLHNTGAESPSHGRPGGGRFRPQPPLSGPHASDRFPRKKFLPARTSPAGFFFPRLQTARGRPPAPPPSFRTAVSHILPVLHICPEILQKPPASSGRKEKTPDNFP